MDILIRLTVGLIVGFGFFVMVQALQELGGGGGSLFGSTQPEFTLSSDAFEYDPPERDWDDDSWDSEQ